MSMLHVDTIDTLFFILYTENMELQNYHNKNSHVVRCNCGTPLAKRVASKKIELVKHHNGQQTKIIINYLGDQCSVCCERCGKSFSFITKEIQFELCGVAPLREALP